MINTQVRTTEHTPRAMTLIDYYEDRDWAQRYKVEHGDAQPLAQGAHPERESKESL